MSGRERGSALGEQLIMAALVALFIAMIAAVFSYSRVQGFVLLALSLAGGALAVIFGVLRHRRLERRREERCRLELERAAAAQQAVLEATFFGTALGGPAAFGIAGTARKLIYAREGYPYHVHMLDFDQVATAFSRPEGENQFRLEVRTRASGDGSPREALFLTVTKREEAERWVQALAPHLGARAKMVERNPQAADLV